MSDDTHRMRTLSYRSVNRVFFVALATVTIATYASAATPTPTFAKDVAPILFEHCVACHCEGESGAALSLVSYESAKSHVTGIREQVVRRQMPPWPGRSAAQFEISQ